MNPGFRLFLDLAPIAFVLMIVTVITALPYRKERAAKSLIAFVCLVAWLIATSVGELVAPTERLTILFAKLEYVSYLYIPITWLSFCLRYTGWITKTDRKLIAFASLAPLAGLAIILTNELHSLVWTRIVIRVADGLSVLRPEHGPFFWLYITYAWTFIGFGSLIVISSFFSGQKLYYRQSLWILAGSIIPGFTNIANLTGLLPGIEKDFTPIGYAVSALCFLAGIYIHRLLWIMPVARSVLIQELNIGVLAIDPHGWIVDHNRKADELLQMDTIAVGHRGIDFPALEAIFDAAGFIPGVDRDFFKTGQCTWKDTVIAWSIQPSTPSARGCLVILVDVTEKATLEREMDGIRRELINREKLATVGRLTAGLAHEINNPVSYLKSDVRSLVTIVNRAEKENANSSMAEIVKIAGGITEGLDRIENVVRTLLAFSREEKIDSPFEPYDLHAGIETTLNIMRYELKDAIGIQKAFGEVPPLRAQRNEINQVLLNILTNACHAIRERAEGERFAGIITIRTGASADKAWCEIENNGTPIPGENRDRIFELFFSTKKSQWGTGLGLNICRDIVENHHGGKLSLESTDPVIFKIELPLEPARTEGSEAR